MEIVILFKAAAQDFVRRLFGWTIWNGSCFYFNELAASILALSVTAYAVPPLPKGEALAKPHTLHFSRKLYRYAKGSPFGRAGALAPERARLLPLCSHPHGIKAVSTPSGAASAKKPGQLFWMASASSTVRGSPAAAASTARLMTTRWSL